MAVENKVERFNHFIKFIFQKMISDQWWISRTYTSKLVLEIFIFQVAIIFQRTWGWIIIFIANQKLCFFIFKCGVFHARRLLLFHQGNIFYFLQTLQFWDISIKLFHVCQAFKIFLKRGCILVIFKRWKRKKNSCQRNFPFSMFMILLQ